MPINATVEYFRAEERFRNAKTKAEKILALEEMIRTAPGHKGAENLLAELKTRLAKLKRQTESKASRMSFSIPREGDAQVCVLGMTQSGKSTLLKKLTNAKPKVSSIPFTTEKPVIGTCDYHGVKIQMIEIPSSFRRDYMSVVQNANAVVLVFRDKKQLDEIQEIKKRFRIEKPVCEVSSEDSEEVSKEKIWKSLGLIRVYTKEPGKKPEKKPIVLKKGSIVKDAVRSVHKDFLESFRFVRIWGPSAKYRGEQFGLEHKLGDGDVLEIHVK